MRVIHQQFWDQINLSPTAAVSTWTGWIHGYVAGCVLHEISVACKLWITQSILVWCQVPVSDFVVWGPNFWLCFNCIHETIHVRLWSTHPNIQTSMTIIQHSSWSSHPPSQGEGRSDTNLDSYLWCQTLSFLRTWESPAWGGSQWRLQRRCPPPRTPAPWRSGVRNLQNLPTAKIHTPEIISHKPQAVFASLSKRGRFSKVADCCIFMMCSFSNFRQSQQLTEAITSETGLTATLSSGGSTGGTSMQVWERERKRERGTIRGEEPLEEWCVIKWRSVFYSCNICIIYNSLVICFW